ncbi:MAG: hypothetical protein RLZ92_1844 [Pseudomonadota bacterium]
MRILFFNLLNKSLLIGCSLVASITLFLPINSQAASDSVTLEELINRALSSYPAVLSRQASKDAASSDVTVAKLRFLPTPSLNSQLNNLQYDSQTNNQISSSQTPSANITVTQPIWAGGGLVAGYDKANARLTAADFALLETKEDVSRRLITAYAEWYKAYHKIQVLKENVLVHEKLVSLITHRFEKGVASGADKDLGLSRLLQAQADLQSQRVQEESALVTIAELIGEPVTSQQLIGKIASYVELPQRAELIPKALAGSVTLQRYKSEAEAAEAEALEVNAQSLPQVSFQVQRQFNNAYYPNSPGFTAMGVVVGYSPGAGLSSFVAAKSAEDRARAAVLQIDLAKSQLVERLNTEYNEYEFSLLKRENLRRSVSLSRDIQESYDRQYLVGRKSWIDLMNTVRERAQTNVTLVDIDGNILGTSRRLLVYLAGAEAELSSDLSVEQYPEKPAQLLDFDLEKVIEERVDRYQFWNATNPVVKSKRHRTR